MKLREISRFELAYHRRVAQFLGLHVEIDPERREAQIPAATGRPRCSRSALLIVDETDVLVAVRVHNTCYGRISIHHGQSVD